jgi:hypothetical protein
VVDNGSENVSLTEREEHELVRFKKVELEKE